MLSHIGIFIEVRTWFRSTALLIGRIFAIVILLSATSHALVTHAQAQTLALAPAASPSAASLEKFLTQFKVDTWQTEQGLPQNAVQAIYQSKAGYLWVGTAGGLARFDGVRFAAFEAAIFPQAASRPIFGFFEDAQGSLWIGHSRGAARYRDGKFEAAFDAALTDGRRVWAFAQGRDGAVWVATENGLVRWNKGVAKLYQEADGLPTNRLRTLDFDRDGTLWIGTTGGGLVAFVDEKFTVMNAASGFPHPEVRHLLVDPAGGVWVATAGGGLVHIDTSKNRKMKTYTVADGLPTDQLTSLARDKSGALWIGTWGAGVTRLHEGRFTTISTANGLGGDQIWALQGDAEGSVWVGSWNGGLNRVSRRAFGVFGKPDGLSSDNVRAVMHARDGTTWVSTAGGGVNQIDGGLVKVINKKAGLATDESSALLEDNEGSVWIGSYTQGVSRYKRGKLESFGVAQGLPNADVRVMMQDRAGTIWVGTKFGLARFDGQRFAAVTTPGAPREGVASILQDRSGILWFGTAGDGLFRYNQSDGVFTVLTRKEGLVSNWVLALYEDAAGSLWIGTNGEGMNRLKNGRLTTIRVADGLWDGTTHVIIEDRFGHLWMTCNRGFFRVARAELDDFADGKIAKVTSLGFGPGHALRSTTFAGGLQPTGNMDNNGHLWLPSLKGLVIVDPTRLPGTEAPPRVIIEEIAINGVIQAANGDAANVVTLPPGSVPLAIRYTAATLLHADRTRFRYKMEGVTASWVDAGKAREAAFPALPHGSYQFRVEASIDGIRWQEAPALLPVKVLPHYYQTPWFIALAILAALAALAGAYRLRTYQLHKQHADMERIVAEKTEALWQANEHLSRLSLTDGLTGLANRRSLDETLESEWRRGLRLQSLLTVVIIDIDNFKAYNDSLGHPEGDKCLIAVAEVIRKAAGRAGDFAARYGGEEFMVIIPGLDHAAAMVYAETLRQACEARALPHPASSVAAVVTISVGVAACVPSSQSSVDALVAQADAALYRAKDGGRNRVR